MWTWWLGKCLCPHSASVFFSILMKFWCLDFQINVCSFTWTTIIGSLVFAASTAAFHMIHAFVEAQKINLKVIYCYKLKIIKLPSSGLSLEVTGQTRSHAAMWLAGQLVQNLSVVTSLGGIKGVWLQHLNLPVALGQHPKCLTDSQGTARDTGVKYCSLHSPLCSVQFVNKLSVI